MTDTQQSPDEVLLAAEAEAREAEQAAEALEQRVVAGDTDVTPEEITRAKGLAEFFRLRKQAAAAKATQLRIDARLQALRDIAAEIEAEAPESGQEMVDAYLGVLEAARKFEETAGTFNNRFYAWRGRLQRLEVKPNAYEESVGLNGINQVMFDGAVLYEVNSATYLALIFDAPDSNHVFVTGDTSKITAGEKALRAASLEG